MTWFPGMISEPIGTCALGLLDRTVVPQRLRFGQPLWLSHCRGKQQVRHRSQRGQAALTVECKMSDSLGPTVL